MHPSDALSRAAVADDKRNTELDVEAQVAPVIKYVPITDKKKMNEIKQMTVSDPTMQIRKNYPTQLKAAKMK